MLSTIYPIANLKLFIHNHAKNCYKKVLQGVDENIQQGDGENCGLVDFGVHI